MPGVSQIVFTAINLKPEYVAGKRVLDVGSCDFNGTVRPLLESWSPAEYLGVDIIEGPGVDLLCSADDLVERFGQESFDLVICLEMLEHTRDWRRTVSNIKRVLRRGGRLVLTTRSLGYPCHGFPDDYWRYEVEDIRQIFSDLAIERLERDPANPGVFLFAVKPTDFVECNPIELELYSIVEGRRIKELSDGSFRSAYFRRLALKQRLRGLASQLFLGAGRVVSKVLRI